jgi:hypothetical protein
MNAFFEAAADLNGVHRERDPILWDVTDDETENLADEYPQRVEQLSKRIDI